MQLSTLVLPAPFGPISASNSPGATISDTSSSTVSPPKRNVRCSTASSAIPSPGTAILLDGAVAAPLGAGAAEIEFLDVAVGGEPRGGAVEHDAAVLQHVAVVGDGERHRGTLLDHENRKIELAADVGEAPHQILDHHRREAERQLVHQQH